MPDESVIDDFLMIRTSSTAGIGLAYALQLLAGPTSREFFPTARASVKLEPVLA